VAKIKKAMIKMMIAMATGIILSQNGGYFRDFFLLDLIFTIFFSRPGTLAVTRYFSISFPIRY
jgi:hypothetical protein